MEFPKFFTKSIENNYSSKRESAQKIINFEKIIELLQRNPKNNSNKTFTQYTKDLLKSYVSSPSNNQDNLREISRFLERNSMIYKKLIAYYANMPLFYYNITQENDWTKDVDIDKSYKNYMSTLKTFEKFNLSKEGFNSLYAAIRDGIYVGRVYNSENEGMFLMPLDVQYCRIYGKTPEGEWIVYFNAAFFDSGNNKDFIDGIDGRGTGAWDQEFIDGYNQYKNNGRDYQWFRLSPEKTFCLISCPDDQFTYPLPYFLPLFKSLLDLLDLEQILQDKTELENYKLIVSKIPLMKNSDDVDDFAISLELSNQFNAALQAIVPELVGCVVSPHDIDTVEFNSNSSDDTDSLNKSMQNLFNNAGASQIVVAGGSSTNSVGLRHALQNDKSTCWIWVNRMQSWINYFIKKNISDGYIFEILPITHYNQEEYIQILKDGSTLGTTKMDYLCALGLTPYKAFQKLKFENAIDILSLMTPLTSSYNASQTTGRPASDEDDLSSEGQRTREKRQE